MRMGKYKKTDNKVAIASLTKNIDIVFKKSKLDNQELMSAIGMLVQMLALGDVTKGDADLEQFRLMINGYIDKIWGYVENDKGSN